MTGPSEVLSGKQKEKQTENDSWRELRCGVGNTYEKNIIIIMC